jgi:L-threonylcarbamoyladenylate synthase
MKTSVIVVDPDASELQKVALAGSVIKRGGIVAFPTDTVYGLGVDIFNEEAVRELYRVKGRAVDKPTSVMISEKEELHDLIAEVSEPAKVLMEAFWPGALTIIFPVSKSGRISRMLAGNTNTIGVRIPANEIAVSLIRECGVPITCPSANVSGHPSPCCAEAVLRELRGEIDLIIDGGSSDLDVPSTVVDLSKRDVRILREGRISKGAVEKIVGDGHARPVRGHPPR